MSSGMHILPGSKRIDGGRQVYVRVYAETWIGNEGRNVIAMYVKGDGTMSNPSWYATIGTKKDHRDRSMKARYRRVLGVSREQADYLLKKRDSSTCEICNGAVRVAVDHNWKTSEFRGVLCFNCNTGLGKFGDSPSRLRAAAAYLEKHA